jgi:hypothetical protein
MIKANEACKVMKNIHGKLVHTKLEYTFSLASHLKNKEIKILLISPEINSVRCYRKRKVLQKELIYFIIPIFKKVPHFQRNLKFTNKL